MERRNMITAPSISIAPGEQSMVFWLMFGDEISIAGVIRRWPGVTLLAIVTRCNKVQNQACHDAYNCHNTIFLTFSPSSASCRQWRLKCQAHRLGQACLGWCRRTQPLCDVLPLFCQLPSVEMEMFKNAIIIRITKVHVNVSGPHLLCS